MLKKQWKKTNAPREGRGVPLPCQSCLVNLATKVYRLGFDHEMVEWFIMIDVVWKIFWPWNGRMISCGKYLDHEMVEWFHTTSALQWDLGCAKKMSLKKSCWKLKYL